MLWLVENIFSSDRLFPSLIIFFIDLALLIYLLIINGVILGILS